MAMVDGDHWRNIPSSKGQRFILAHAGSRQNGFISEAELIFQTKSVEDYYQNEMNGHIFRDRLGNTILPTLDRPSCLVMDNASYHNVIAQEDLPLQLAERRNQNVACE
jgi:hypothetical protein